MSNNNKRGLVFLLVLVLALLYGKATYAQDSAIALPDTPNELTALRLIAGGYYLVYVPIMTNTGAYPDRCQTFDGLNNFLHSFGLNKELALMPQRVLTDIFDLCNYSGG